MIELTQQQLHDLQESGPIAINPTTNEEYVLVPRLVYERMCRIMGNDDVLASGELVDRVMAEDDANDPTLASYQSLDEWPDHGATR
ncbi:MAG: hypothetical protein FJ271_14875 [Planctomycetes bacterium]|nr:hypothetical protein [Planctomycetota bacterium]